MIRKYLLPISGDHRRGARDPHGHSRATGLGQSRTTSRSAMRTRHFPLTSSAPGIVEASTENIAVGTPVSGIVTAMYVKWGDRVKTERRLFKVDTRDLEAQLPAGKRQSERGGSAIVAGDRQSQRGAGKPGKN